MTPAETVSINVRRLRKARDWSQKQAAEMLGGLIGEQWSNATWSVAEKVGSGRQRSWTANELAALAEMFGVTIGDLFNEVCSACEGEPYAGFTCNTCGVSA